MKTSDKRARLLSGLRRLSRNRAVKQTDLKSVPFYAILNKHPRVFVVVRDRSTLFGVGARLSKHQQVQQTGKANT